VEKRDNNKLFGEKVVCASVFVSNGGDNNEMNHPFNHLSPFLNDLSKHML
jgi:hypothetical protein